MAASIRTRTRNLSPYLYLAPSMLVICLILLYPIAYSVILSFFKLDLMSGVQQPRFTGISNYLSLFEDRSFWRSALLTIIYTCAMAGGSFLCGLIAALVLDQNFRGRGVARTMAILPWAISPAVACIIWVWMLDYDFGVINYLLTALRILPQRVAWLSAGIPALFSVSIVTIWKFTPISAVVLLAGLQTIPPELYESGRIDGANLFQLFRHVTLPGIKPVSAILFNLLVLWGFRRFEIIFIMTGGGPAGATETLIINTYQEAFRFFDMGRASAIGTFTLLIAMTFSVIYLKMLFRED